MPRREQPANNQTRIEVHPDETMPSILTELRRHRGESVVLAIPGHCPVLLTAVEFRALKDVADRAQVHVTIESEDRLRAQLATMFGIPMNGGHPDSSESGWRPPDTLLGNKRAYDTWGPQDEDEKPGRRRRDDEPSRRSGAMDYIREEQAGVGMTARRIGAIVGAVVALGLILLLAGWYAMPGVTVRATLQQTQVTSQAIYAVAAEGASLPSDIAFTAPASQESADVPFTITVPTTGVNRTPQDTAHGSVLLRNPTGEAITVPAGTTLSVHAGPSFTTDAEVSVPAAADNVAGETSVDVTASEPGSVGNVDAGMLTGKVPDLDVYYSNRDGDIEGGTDIEVAIVSEADITALQDKIQNDYNRAAADGWNSQLGEGQSVVLPSVTADPPQVAIAAQPGQEATEISVSGTVHATGLVYQRGAVEEQAMQYFRTSLADQVPEGFELNADSIRLSEPSVLSQAPDQVQYRVEATATATAAFSDQQRSDLESALTGSSWNDARDTLRNESAFASWELDRSPGWWPARMPRSSGRVHVETSVPPVTPAATPEGSP